MLNIGENVRVTGNVLVYNDATTENIEGWIGKIQSLVNGEAALVRFKCRTVRVPLDNLEPAPANAGLPVS